MLVGYVPSIMFFDALSHQDMAHLEEQIKKAREVHAQVPIDGVGRQCNSDTIT